MRNERTNNKPNQPESCCTSPEVWVVNSGTEFACHACGHRSPTGHRPTVSVWDNQFQ
mgnify:CR=1 FL=1